MAMTDYFYQCRKVEKVTVSDGIGGYKVAYYYGINFNGLAVNLSTQEKIVGALSGKEQAQKRFHAEVNFPLQKDDIVSYVEPTDPEQREQFLRLTSNSINNPIESQQEDWKTYEAETYTPSNILEI